MLELAPYYFFVYWFAVLLLTIFKFDEIYNCHNYMVLYKKDNYKPFIIFSVFFIIMFGMRPISGLYFGDTSNYAAIYQMFETYGSFYVEGSSGIENDWLFYIVMVFCAQIMNVNGFFVIVICFYVMMMFAGCRKLDFQHGATIMLFCIGAFSFYAYAVNGIRNGVACSIVILALAGVCRGERVWPVLLTFLAIGCHKSTALPLACMFFSYFVRNPKYMYGIWLGAFILSLVFGEIISQMIVFVGYDDRISTYLSMNSEEASELIGIALEKRFRWDFLVYSIIPLILGAYTLFVRKVYNSTYLILLGTYTYANAFWIIVIRDIFSNRFAYLSWFLYPIVLAYPLLNLPVFEKNHSQKVSLILLGHFGFTTIMWMLGK